MTIKRYSITRVLVYSLYGIRTLIRVILVGYRCIQTLTSTPSTTARGNVLMALVLLLKYYWWSTVLMVLVLFIEYYWWSTVLMVLVLLLKYYCMG